jgi:ABC-type sugar transport system permease subunit
MLKYKWWESILFLAPTLLAILFVFGYPLFRIFDFSTRRIRGISGPFIGLDNYRFALRAPVFQLAVKNNAFLLIGVPIMVLIAVIIAALLFEQLKGWRFYRFCLFIPYIIAIPVIGVIFSYMLSLHGVLNELLEKIGLGFFTLDWLGNPRIALKTILIIVVWKEIGFGMILFLARLMSVSPDLYDAAKIDGANWWHALWRITIPQLRLVIEFFAVISMVNLIAWVFSYVYVITNGGPGNSTQVIELWIFNKVSRGAPNPGMGAAASVMLLVVSSVFIFSLLKLRLRIGEE